jgi:hypothetical protein
MFQTRGLTCQLIKWHFISPQLWFCKHSPHCPLCNLWRDCLSAHKLHLKFPHIWIEKTVQMCVLPHTTSITSCFEHFMHFQCSLPVPAATFNTSNTHWEATDRVMAVQLTTLTRKTATLQHLVAESYTTCLLGSSSKFGSFCTHLYIERTEMHTFLSLVHDSHQLHTLASPYMVVTKRKVLSMLGTEPRLSSPLFWPIQAQSCKIKC